MAAAEVQSLLRFLTQDAKIPLGDALPKIGGLIKRGLNTPVAIAAADPSSIQDVFVDEKIAKQVANAAKRLSHSKKRTASQPGLPLSKRSRLDQHDQSRDIEAELALPVTHASDEELGEIEIEINRAPLVLAFAVVTLEFSMPDQPLSSRLSLAQAVVSANSQSKAKAIGLIAGTTAEDDGWAQGQPKVRVLSREIAVMRRQTSQRSQEIDGQETLKADSEPSYNAFWGLDLEALRKANGPLVAGKLAGSQGPPIHTPQAARSYLLKSIAIKQPEASLNGSGTSPKKKKSYAESATLREQATAMLLKSIRIVCESWGSTLSTEELDRRAWAWYLSVRPDVAQGQSGWGQKGTVRLADIIRLKRVT